MLEPNRYYINTCMGTSVLMALFNLFFYILCDTWVLICTRTSLLIYSFIYLGFYGAFNTVQVISRRVVGRAEETST